MIHLSLNTLFMCWLCNSLTPDLMSVPMSLYNSGGPCVSVLRAIDEDSPTVPTLLTDYILKGRCLLAGLVRRLRAAVRSPQPAAAHSSPGPSTA